MNHGFSSSAGDIKWSSEVRIFFVQHLLELALDLSGGECTDSNKVDDATSGNARRTKQQQQTLMSCNIVTHLLTRVCEL